MEKDIEIPKHKLAKIIFQDHIFLNMIFTMLTPTLYHKPHTSKYQNQSFIHHLHIYSLFKIHTIHNSRSKHNLFVVCVVLHACPSDRPHRVVGLREEDVSGCMVKAEGVELVCS